MENILKKLFDYQKFENNENLERIIKDSQKKRPVKLSDDALQLLNAAGNISETNLFENKLSSLSEGDCFVDNSNNRYRVIEDYQDIEMGIHIKVCCIDIPWLDVVSYNNLIDYKYVGKNVF